MKTETTKRLEQLLANRFNKRNEFYVFECTIGWYGKEIVDCIMYNCQRETYCYEIKQSKQDFHSKNRLTFIGNKNYFVMPYKLYKEVEDEIPKLKSIINLMSKQLSTSINNKACIKQYFENKAKEVE